MSDEALRETLLSYARSPRNGSLSNTYTHRGERTNSRCGDQVELRLTVTNGRIVAASFAARGCAISTASAALLDEVIVGAPVGDARKRAQLWITTLNGTVDSNHVDGADWAEYPEAPLFDAIAGNSARHRCALLPWEALLAALETA